MAKTYDGEPTTNVLSLYLIWFVCDNGGANGVGPVGFPVNASLDGRLMLPLYPIFPNCTSPLRFAQFRQETSLAIMHIYDVLESDESRQSRRDELVETSEIGALSRLGSDTDTYNCRPSSG